MVAPYSKLGERSVAHGKKRKTGERFPPTQDENTVIWLKDSSIIPGGISTEGK